MAGGDRRGRTRTRRRAEDASPLLSFAFTFSGFTDKYSSRGLQGFFIHLSADQNAKGNDANFKVVIPGRTPISWVKPAILHHAVDPLDLNRALRILPRGATDDAFGHRIESDENDVPVGPQQQPDEPDEPLQQHSPPRPPPPFPSRRKKLVGYLGFPS